MADENCGEPLSEDMVLANNLSEALHGTRVQTAARALVYALAAVITQHATHPADMKMMRDNCVSLLFEKTEPHIEQAWADLPEDEQAEASGEDDGAPTVLN